MTNEQQEGTRIIAEFLQWEKEGNRYWFPNAYPLPDNGDCTLLNIDSAFFHTSFDWLMPVYVKAKNIVDDSLEIQINGRFNAVKIVLLNGLPEPLFSELVKFLTWLKSKATP